MRSWQIQDAKNKFSEVVAEAAKHGPQVVTKRGVETAVVLSYEEYRKMLAHQQPLSKFFGESPLADLDLQFTRDKSPARGDIRF